VPIRKFTGFYNPKYKKINVKFLYRDSFVFTPHFGGAERKMLGCRKKLPHLRRHASKAQKPRAILVAATLEACVSQKLLFFFLLRFLYIPR